MSKKTLTLSNKEFRLLREMCDSWVPEHPFSISLDDDMVLTSIADKIQDIRDSEGCQGQG